MSGKPKKLYYVECRGGKLRYGERGGGKFSILAHALERKKQLERRGCIVRIFESQEIEWKEIS